MRALGLLMALGAIDQALTEQAEAARRRPAPAPTPIDAAGEPADRLDDANAATRLAGWRGWARRGGEAPADSPLVRLLRPGSADRTPTTG